LERERFRLLLDAAKSLGAMMEHDELLSHILVQSMKVMDAEASSIFVADAATSELVMHVPQGTHADRLDSVRMPDTQGIAGHVYHSCEVLQVDDPSNDSRFFSDVDKRSGFVTRALLCAPLLNQGECVGVIQVLNPRGRLAFEKTDHDYFEGFARLAAATLVRMQLQEQCLRQKRLEQELAIAIEIQNSFLPKKLPASACVRVAVCYHPAREVSGDFYHVTEFDDGRTLLAVGDVSGKGVPAALTMARVTAEIRAAGKPGPKLAEWVTALNRSVSMDISGGRFVALSVLLFDPLCGEVQVCLAGQHPPLRGKNGEWEPVEVQSHPPLGVVPDWVFDAHSFPLINGEKWMITTDGVQEARNESGEEWGAGNLLSIPCVGSPAVVLNNFKGVFSAFVGKSKPHDDATLLVAEWRGGAPTKEWHLPAMPGQLKTVRAHIEKWAAFLGYDDLVIGQIVLAVDEASSNVIRYAYHGGEGAIHYKVLVEGDEFVLVMRDFGTPVEISKVQGRDIDDVRPGGLGLFFMNQAFESICYEPMEKGTILTMKRKLPV